MGESSRMNLADPVTIEGFREEFSRFLINYKSDTSRQQDNLVRLSGSQFYDLASDVYDELARRQNRTSEGPILISRPDFSMKRNFSRQTLAILPLFYFRTLCADIHNEIWRRYPQFHLDVHSPSSPTFPSASGELELEQTDDSKTGGPRLGVNDLPPELLEKVFDACLSQHPASHNFPQSENAGMALSHICSHWRKIAISMKKLWCFINFGNRNPYKPMFGNSGFQRLLQLRKERVGSYGFDILLPGAMSFMQAPLAPFIRQCRKLTFYVQGNFSYPGLAPLIKEAKGLQTIVIESSDCSETQVDQLTAVIRSAPNLKYLFWRGFSVPPALHHHFWPQLTHVTFERNFGLDDCLAFLSRCDHLVHFRALISPPPGCDPDEVALPSVVLLLLKSLSISYKGNLSNIFDHLTLPSLRTLCISTHQVLGYNPESDAASPFPSSFNEFLLRSGCALQTLNINLPEPQLWRIVCRAPLSDLQEFILSSPDGISNRILAGLVYGRQSNSSDSEAGLSSNLASLTSLSVSGCTGSIEAIQTVLASRSAKSMNVVAGVLSPLQHLTVSFALLPIEFDGREYAPPAVAELRRFGETAKDGLRISVAYEGGMRIQHYYKAPGTMFVKEYTSTI